MTPRIQATRSISSPTYNGAGACSVFRMFQGWMSMSTTGLGEGKLLVNPMLPLATAYYLLRPFFAPKNSIEYSCNSNAFLQPADWNLITDPKSDIQGANPGSCQELNSTLHPHLHLSDSMVHIPQINPGDYIAWHCDTIHAVDSTHLGKSDSSVLYIPVFPPTVPKAQYLIRQRAAFLAGTPGPDFPGGRGESEHSGQPPADFVGENGGVDTIRAFGLQKWDAEEVPEGIDRLMHGQREVLRSSNEILGFE